MVITFSKGEKDGEKRVLQVALHHIRICLEMRWLLLPPLRHPLEDGERGRMPSDSSAGVQRARGAGAGRNIFKGSTAGLQSQPGSPNLPQWPSQNTLNALQPDQALTLFSAQSGKERGWLCPWLWVPASPKACPCLPSPAGERTSSLNEATWPSANSKLRRVGISTWRRAFPQHPTRSERPSRAPTARGDPEREHARE